MAAAIALVNRKTKYVHIAPAFFDFKGFGERYGEPGAVVGECVNDANPGIVDRLPVIEETYRKVFDKGVSVSLPVCPNVRLDGSVGLMAVRVKPWKEGARVVGLVLKMWEPSRAEFVRGSLSLIEQQHADT